jgi:glycosyltransferase involved in cell wall biosynthesis
MKPPVYSFVIPVYNEAGGILSFHGELIRAINDLPGKTYEVIYCDDGSTDRTTIELTKLSKNNPGIKLVRLSRNFGKEIATSAGMHLALGDAIITLDADGQHPVDYLPQFIEKWESGSKVVIGVRQSNQKEGLIKKLGSKLFYRIFNRLTGMKLIPYSTDFRLIDRSVATEFARMTERNRITRGLIDWLGFERSYIYFPANSRQAGTATYSFNKLLKLAIDSMVSLSISPLYITAYIGALVLPLSVLLGLSMVIEALIGDPLNINASGSAYVVVFILFLIGILLVSQGIIGLYLSHIHIETQNRPLYIIDKGKSLNLHE